MSSIDEIIHDAQDLIHALQNTSPVSPPDKIGNTHKEELIFLAEIFVKATSPAVPLRVPFRGTH